MNYVKNADTVAATTITASKKSKAAATDNADTASTASTDASSEPTLSFKIGDKVSKVNKIR